MGSSGISTEGIFTPASGLRTPPQWELGVVREGGIGGDGGGGEVMEEGGPPLTRCDPTQVKKESKEG